MDILKTLDICINIHIYLAVNLSNILFLKLLY